MTSTYSLTKEHPLPSKAFSNSYILLGLGSFDVLRGANSRSLQGQIEYMSKNKFLDSYTSIGLMVTVDRSMYAFCVQETFTSL